MKRVLMAWVALILALTACSTPEEAPQQSGLPEPVLTVTDGVVEQSYTRADLEVLGAVEVDNGDAVYVGVVLKTLLEDAGIDLAAIAMVEARATDGFSANYDADIFLADNTLVAYARADGPLASNEGNFRMVVPDQAGAMNPRLLSRLIAIP